MKKPASVREYLASLPAGKRAALQRLRKTIKEAAPKATEELAWSMPYFRQGRLLAGYYAFTNHCTLFVGPQVMQQHAAALEKYSTTKAGVHFTPDKPLPATLVKKLIRSCIAINKEHEREKQ